MPHSGTVQPVAHHPEQHRPEITAEAAVVIALDSAKCSADILCTCRPENAPKIEEFLRRADAGEDEMFEVLNSKTGEREFFVPVRNDEGHVIGYFERHEVPWDEEHADVPVGDYWLRRKQKAE